MSNVILQGELFAPDMPADTLQSTRLRFMAVPSDNLEPTIRRGDYVLTVPVTDYLHEGIYAVSIHAVGVMLYRVQPAFDGKGGLRLSSDNPLYGSHVVPAEWFADNVLAYVVADVRVRDHGALLAATGRA